MTRNALQHELHVVSRCSRRSTSSFGQVMASCGRFALRTGGRRRGGACLVWRRRAGGMRCGVQGAQTAA